MKRLKLNLNGDQYGLIPIMLFLLAILVLVVVFVYMRVASPPR